MILIKMNEIDPAFKKQAQLIQLVENYFKQTPIKLRKFESSN